MYYYWPQKRLQYCFQHHQNFLNTITHELMDLAWWNFARTCTLTTSRTPLNIKVIGQKSMSCLCVSCVHDTAWNGWPGLTKCHSLDGGTLLLSAEATAANCGQYLALSKAWRLCLHLLLYFTVYNDSYHAEKCLEKMTISLNSVLSEIRMLQFVYWIISNW